jgi:hypothetical protein
MYIKGKSITTSGKVLIGIVAFIVVWNLSVHAVAFASNQWFDYRIKKEKLHYEQQIKDLDLAIAELSDIIDKKRFEQKQAKCMLAVLNKNILPSMTACEDPNDSVF